MKAAEHERQDWIVLFVLLILGFLCVIVAGQLALRFSPTWKLDANMDSHLNPNSDFLTRRPDGFVEPVDPAILTQPVWINLFLTPGASFVSGTPFPSPTAKSLITSTITGTPITTPTPMSLTATTNTVVVFASLTGTVMYYPPAPSSTSPPNPSATFTAAPTSIFTPSATPISTGTSTGTSTSSSTPTSTPTTMAMPTFTSTQTTDSSEPDFGGPDGNTATLGNGTWLEFNLSGFILDGNSTWDAVYYELEEASSAGKVHLGAVQIEVYDQTTSAWYTIYNWGDGVADTNASYNNGNAEPDGFPVDKSLLFGTPPLNTGIAIDIDTPAIGQGGSIGDLITTIRITSLSNANCEVDSLQMLR